MILTALGIAASLLSSPAPEAWPKGFALALEPTVQSGVLLQRSAPRALFSAGLGLSAAYLWRPQLGSWLSFNYRVGPPLSPALSAQRGLLYDLGLGPFWQGRSGAWLGLQAGLSGCYGRRLGGQYGRAADTCQGLGPQLGARAYWPAYRAENWQTGPSLTARVAGLACETVVSTADKWQPTRSRRDPLIPLLSAEVAWAFLWR